MSKNNEATILSRLVCEGDEVELLEEMNQIDCEILRLGAAKLVAMGIRYALALQKPIEQITVADLFLGDAFQELKVKP